MEHVRDDLSAYLDGALTPARRAAVEGHLGGCAVCRTALAELRTTARLISALPAPAPSRRLVPALTPARNWLRPLRSLSAIAAATFLFVFMASATLDTGFRMGGGRAGLPGIGGPAAAPAGQTNASTSPPAEFQDQRTTAIATASPKSAADAAATARTQGAGVGTVGATAATEALREARAPEPLRIGPSPWIWLALTLGCASAWYFFHRRVRRTTRG